MSNLEKLDFDPKEIVCYNCRFNGGEENDNSGNILCDKNGLPTNPKCVNLACFVKDNVDGVIKINK